MLVVYSLGLRKGTTVVRDMKHCILFCIIRCALWYKTTIYYYYHKIDYQGIYSKQFYNYTTKG